MKTLNFAIRVLGSVSPTCLSTAFTPVAPKSVKNQSSCQYLFMLLGSTGAKAARRMLMKLTPNHGGSNPPIFNASPIQVEEP